MSTDEAVVRHHDSSTSRGYGVIRSYDTELIETAFGNFWEEIPTKRKLAILKGFMNPSAVTEFRNVPTIGQHEMIARSTNRDTTFEPSITHLAIGVDNSVATDYQNRSLNDERYRAQIARSENDGTMLRTETFLSATEANDMKTDDNFVREIGLATGPVGGSDLYLCNHALVDPEPKSSSTVMSIEMNLEWVQ